jgi:hypothetical protein
MIEQRLGVHNPFYAGVLCRNPSQQPGGHCPTKGLIPLGGPQGPWATGWQPADRLSSVLTIPPVDRLPYRHAITVECLP